MMEFVIEHRWQFWELIGGMVIAAGIWFFVSYVIIEKYMNKRKGGRKDAADDRQ
jgi:hypothetical protein